MKQNGGSDQHGGARSRQAVEIFLTLCTELHIEAGQTQGCTRSQQEGGHPAGLVQWNQCPHIHQYSRSDTEGKHIAHRIILCAEIGLGMQQACNPTIEDVEDDGCDQRPCRQFESPLHGGDQRIETGKQACGGKQARQDINTPFANRIRLVHWPFLRTFLCLFSWLFSL